MKENLTRMWKAALSLVLALVMVIGLCPAAFATAPEYSEAGVKAQLETLTDLLEEFGPDALEAAKKYVADQGYAAEVEAIVADLEGKLEVAAEAYVAETKAAILAAVEELEAKAEATEAELEELKAQLAKAKAELEAAVDGAVESNAVVAAELEATIAVLEAAIAEIEAELAETQAITDNLIALAEDLEVALTDLVAAVVAMNAAVENIGVVLEAETKATAEAAAEVVAAAVETAKAAVAVVETAVERVVVLGEEAAELAVDAYEQFYALGEVVAADLIGLAVAGMQTPEYAAAVAAIKAEAEAHIAAAKAELVPVIEAKYAEAEEYLTDPETQAAIKAEAEALQAELAAIIAKAEADAEAANAALNAKVEAALAPIAAAKAELEAAVNAAIADATALNECLKAKVADAVATIEAEVEAAVAAFEAAYINATTAQYTVTEDSLYVAIGDASAVADSYVGVIEEMLEVETENLSQKGLTVADAVAVVEKNADTIAKADLITLGFNNTTFIEKAIDAALVADEADWASIVGAEGAAKIAAAVAQIKAELALFIEDEASVDVIAAAVEAYAYSVVSYAYNLPALVEAVRAVNADAIVVIVGMYNPLADITIEMDGTAVAIGDYLDVLVAAADVYATAYAMLTSNGIAVAAPAAETEYAAEGGATTVDAMALGMQLVRFADNFLPSEAGDVYIAEQIIDALNVKFAEVEDDFLWGDVNGDGLVNTKDATLILQYYVKKIGADNENLVNLAAGDVDGNGVYNSKDSMLILRKYLKFFDKFPVEN